MRVSLGLLLLVSVYGPAGAAEVVSVMRTVDGRLIGRPMVVLQAPGGQAASVVGGVVETFNRAGRMLEATPFDATRFARWSGGRERLTAGQRMLFTVPLSLPAAAEPARARLVFNLVNAAGGRVRLARDYWLGEAAELPPAPEGAWFEVYCVPDALEGVRLGRRDRVAFGFQIQLQESGGSPVTVSAVEWLARAADGRPVAEGKLDAVAIAAAWGSTLVGPDGCKALAAQRFEVSPGGEPCELLVRAVGKAAGADLAALGRFALTPPPERTAATRLRLPVRGTWRLFRGPGDGSYNSTDAYTWLLDRLDGRRQPFAGRGDRLSEHYAFDQPVYAPAAGIVTQAMDLVADAATPLELGRFTGYVGLNHLVIDHGNGEQSYLGGLKQFSVRVRANQRVEAGQDIARVGNGDTGAERPALLYRLRRPDGLSLAARFDAWRLQSPEATVALPAAPEVGDQFRAE